MSRKIIGIRYVTKYSFIYFKINPIYFISSEIVEIYDISIY